MTKNNILTSSQTNNNAQNQVQNFDISIFQVVDGKVNLTKMAKSQNKDIREFSKLKGTKAFLSALQQGAGNSTHLCIIDGVGTFGTREVALKLAQWISPEFEVFCIKQLDTLFQTGKVELAPKPTTSLDASRLLAKQVLELCNQIEQQQQIIQEQTPKVELASNYLENGDNMNLSTTAKALRIKVSDLTNLLYSKYIFDQRGNKVPYAEYLDWFYCKPFVAQNGHKGTQLLVTPLGFKKLSKLITKPNLLEKITNLFK